MTTICNATDNKLENLNTVTAATETIQSTNRANANYEEVKRDRLDAG